MEFLLLITYVFNSLFLTVVLFSVTYNLFSSSLDLEKFSTYECGFSPLSNARARFDIKFYVVAILFIIFDVEIAFLFPAVMLFNYLTGFELFVITIFLLTLTLGFIYEWASGSLQWS